MGLTRATSIQWFQLAIRSAFRGEQTNHREDWESVQSTVQFLLVNHNYFVACSKLHPGNLSIGILDCTDISLVRSFHYSYCKSNMAIPRASSHGSRTNHTTRRCG